MWPTAPLNPRQPAKPEASARLGYPSGKPFARQRDHARIPSPAKFLSHAFPLFPPSSPSKHGGADASSSAPTQRPAEFRCAEGSS